MAVGAKGASEEIEPVLQAMQHAENDDILVFDDIEDVVRAAGHEANRTALRESLRSHLGMFRNRPEHFDQAPDIGSRYPWPKLDHALFGDELQVVFGLAGGPPHHC